MTQDQINPVFDFGATEPDLHLMSRPCRCGSVYGRLSQQGAHTRVDCAECGQYVYFAPKTETGERQRSVSTVHAAIKPRQRARIIERATGRCELCGAGGILHVGHMLSVDAGVALGLTEVELNSDENLAAMCEECNLGQGRLPISPRLYVALLKRRQP